MFVICVLSKECSMFMVLFVIYGCMDSERMREKRTKKNGRMKLYSGRHTYRNNNKSNDKFQVCDTNCNC